jgi:hypothetical protein
MTARILRHVLPLLLVGSVGCGPGVDLATDLTVSDVLTGWYDNGVKDGKNHLVPSISFRLQNAGAAPISGVQLTVAYWREGADGEFDSVLVRGIGDEALEPGASTEPILVRSRFGYTLEGARADFFLHSQFQDATARLFAKRGGRIVPIGQYVIERRIIPHVLSEPGTR